MRFLACAAWPSLVVFVTAAVGGSVLARAAGPAAWILSGWLPPPNPGKRGREKFHKQP